MSNEKNFRGMAAKSTLNNIDKLIDNSTYFDYHDMIDVIARDIEEDTLKVSGMKTRALNGIKILLYVLTKLNKNQNNSYLLTMEDEESPPIENKMEIIHNFMKDNKDDIIKILKELNGKYHLASDEAKPIRHFITNAFGKDQSETIINIINENALKRRRHLLTLKPKRGGRKRYIKHSIKKRKTKRSRAFKNNI
jgi:hypothetical protein